VQILGSDAETASDVDLVCCKPTFPVLSASVLETAAGLAGQLSKTDLKQRLDLRSLLTLTIEAEGPDSSLIENAFTLEKTKQDFGSWAFTFRMCNYILPENPRQGLPKAGEAFTWEKQCYLCYRRRWFSAARCWK